MNPDKTAPKGPVIWVHIFCNIGYLRTYEEERADVKSHDWWAKGNLGL